MTEVLINRKFKYGGETYNSGQTADLPDSVASEAIDKGYAEETSEIEIETEEIELGGDGEDGGEGTSSELTSAEDAGFDPEEWAGGNNWLSAKDDAVEIGTTMEVVSEEFEVSIFNKGTEDERKYPVVTVDLDGEEYKLRLNKKNYGHLSDAWGSKAENWQGKEIRVVSIETYSGIGEKGMILQPAESV